MQLVILCIYKILDKQDKLKKGQSVNVLREPAETIPIALSLQDTAHVNLHWPQIQLLQRHFALLGKHRHNWA